jgi:hypothetical protein
MAGGGLAQALSGAMTGRRLGSLNQFAAQDAQENRQSVRDLFGETRGIVSQQNLGEREDIRDYDKKMTALGGSLSSGLTNTASAINANQALGLGFGSSNTISYPPYQNPTNPWGGNLWNPYQQIWPYKQPPMMSTGK